MNSDCDPAAQRGVRNPLVVDLIARNGDEVVLTMVEDRPWGESEDQLDQLQEKFNNYLDYILDGWLSRDYPHYTGLRYQIRIEGRSTPNDLQLRLFSALEQCCAEHNIGFKLT